MRPQSMDQRKRYKECYYKTSCRCRWEINEIQKFLDTIKPACNKGENKPLDNEEEKEILQ